MLTAEAGERHVFPAMTARYPAGTSGNAASESILGRWSYCYKRDQQQDWKWDIPLARKESVRNLQEGRSCGEGVVTLEGEFKRITGLEAV
jgi:hypothetical protein